MVGFRGFTWVNETIPHSDAITLRARALRSQVRNACPLTARTRHRPPLHAVAATAASHPRPPLTRRSRIDDRVNLRARPT